MLHGDKLKPSTMYINWLKTKARVCMRDKLSPICVKCLKTNNTNTGMFAQLSVILSFVVDCMKLTFNTGNLTDW